MGHKKKRHAPGPVPRGNRSQVGPGAPADQPGSEPEAQAGDGAAFSEQDPKRRLGGYETAGEHAIQQPGGKNDAQRGSGGR
jgi:hypothetical protein